MPAATDNRLARLRELFASLPGLGPKSAARLVEDLLARRREQARELVQLLDECVTLTRHCPRCRTLITTDSCPICDASERDQSVICVVESQADQLALEQSGSYRGRYFVLLGRVVPQRGTTPEELGIGELLEQAAADAVSEVILATSYTPEGEITAHLIAAALKRRRPELRVTRLARGLPAGVEVEYTDAASITAAITERRPLTSES